MAALVVLFLASCICQVLCQETALDRYVQDESDRDVFGYTLVNTIALDDIGSTVYIYNFTSLRWKDASFSDTPVWNHQLIVSVPNNILYQDAGLLLIWAGNTDDPIPDQNNEVTVNISASFAADSGMVTSVLKQVPNQPMVFAEDSNQESRSEDNLIGFTWRKFMMIDNCTDPDVLAMFPMTKAAVRAMDAVQEISPTLTGHSITRFGVTGASKRGWTTYLTAAADYKNRVFAINPMVMSLLNTMTALHAHNENLGGYTWALWPYWRENVTHMIDTWQADQMALHIDPYSYRDRYTMPKLVTLSCNDEFFLIDESHHYWDGLPGPKYLLMLENSTHVMAGHWGRINDNLWQFMWAVLDNVPLPEVSWTLVAEGNKGRITFNTDMRPTDIRAYYAESSEEMRAPDAPRMQFRRDFRRTIANGTWWTEPELDVSSTFFYEAPVEELGTGHYRVEFDDPEPGTGFLAFFISAQYTLANGRSFEMTTEVNIIPNVRPYDPCTGASCHLPLK